MKYPKTKEMLIPYINEDNSGIRVGGHQMNIARDIEVDDVSNFYELLKSLNGKNDLKKISEINDLDFKDTLDILETLKNSGIIYENNKGQFDFSTEEYEYYDRNLNFFSWIDTKGLYYNYWEVQNILKKSNVLLLGAGGTGSHCAESLARLGIGNLTILDFDNIETSNLNRQSYSYTDVGTKKIQALKNNLTQINPFINIEVENIKIDNVNDLLEIYGDFDIVISCIDKPRNIIDILDSYSKIKNIPWILGGYASTIMNHAIFDSTSTSFSKIISADKEQNYDSMMLFNNTDWQWNNAIISPIANISGNISALYCFYYLTKLKDIEKSKVHHIDFFNIQNLEDFTYLTGEGTTNA